MAGRGGGAPAQNGALAVGVSTLKGTPRGRRAGEPAQDTAAVPLGDAPDPGAPVALRVSPAFTPLKWTSLIHSCVYLSLLLCAFALGKPQPETFVLGMTHGLLWIGMSLACITAARMRIVSLRLAVAVAVLGGIGPFFGSYEFLREQRGRKDH